MPTDSTPSEDRVDDTQAAPEPQSSLNNQIVDALALVTSTTVAGAEIVADGGLRQVAAHCAGLAMLNAVQAQQNAQVMADAVVAAAIRGIASALQGERPA